MPRAARHPAQAPASAPGDQLLAGWFASKGWQPHQFQLDAWAHFAAGRSGLIQVPTGSGKTYAAFGGPLADLADRLRLPEPHQGIHTLYITPLRAISRDIALALQQPITDLTLPARVECRTGDTSAATRQRQRDSLPHVLVTTPESLTLLLTADNAAQRFASLRAVILDEWHELLSSKRGTQAELALARLRTLAPHLRTWALSATIANADQAARAAVGIQADPVLVTAPILRRIRVDSILPDTPDQLPWAGHFGLRMLPRVLDALDPATPTLVFTNTRAQAELWFRAILALRPDLEPITALHHGSIDRQHREAAEAGLKDGSIRIVVATSSLDLGVDFQPVERVLQIGSPKGVARLVQRAGRASHRPGADCHILCVPTHGLELLEIDAARRAIDRGTLEARTPADKPLDVLAQHLVSCALGGGFDPDALFREITSAYAYRNLSREEFDWTLVLVRDGGDTLKAYDRFKRVRLVDNLYRVPDDRLARIHRFNVGTIVSEATMSVRLRSGKRLGSIEEGFVAILRPGERFVFAGRVLRFLAVRDLDCITEPAAGGTSLTPHWAGAKLPISECLSEAVRDTLERAADPARRDSPELHAADDILTAQAALSRIPRHDQILAESTRTREGTHLFLFPFEGRLAHAGLASLLALRLSRTTPTTFALAVNDYGLELLTSDPIDLLSLLTPDLFDARSLSDDILHSANLSDLAKVQFREIARISGLITQSYPGLRKSGSQTQASASLIFDVFSEFDPANLFLLQARREVLDRHFEHSRLARLLARLRHAAETDQLLRVPTPRPTPLAYPLIVERVAALLSGETLEQRLAKMRAEWDKAQPSSPPPTRPSPSPRRTGRSRRA